MELEGARIALLSQFSYSQLSSAATKSVLLGFDLRLGISLSYAHAKGKGSPKRGRRMNSSAVVKGYFFFTVNKIFGTKRTFQIRCAYLHKSGLLRKEIELFFFPLRSLLIKV